MNITPGPWTVDSESIHADQLVYQHATVDSDIIVQVPTQYRAGGLITDQDRANLKAIAALPELIAALQGMLRFYASARSIGERAGVAEKAHDALTAAGVPHV